MVVLGYGAALRRRRKSRTRSAARLMLPLLLACLSVAAASEEPARLHQYTVSADEALTHLQVRACFDGKPPRRLVAESLDAAGVLEQAAVEGTKHAFEPNGTELRLGTLPAGACIVYGVDLTDFTARHQRGGNPTRHVGSDLITDLGVWFWRPDTLDPDEDIEVVFDLPAGISASAPWRPTSRGDGKPAYRVGHGPYDWPAAVAFGRFRERMVEVAGAQLHIAVLDARPKLDEDQITDWLKRAAAAVATLYGRFPVPSVQVLIIPSSRGGEPVPWAYVLRGGGPAAHFFVNQRRSIVEFYTDWTAVHELSDLLLPYVQSEDAWLSEGAASYYQNVLRARAGIIDARQAWAELNAGFARSRNTMRGGTLADATEHMYRSGAYQRVYWEGAAIMLMADERLRAQSAGQQSLDSVLDQLQRCCLSTEVGWHARDLFDKLDALTGRTVFAQLYEQHVRSERFPDLAGLTQRLGVAVDAQGQVALTDDAPERDFRDAIMAPHAAPSVHDR